MRIFLIGKSLAAASFADYFTKNPQNIVFSTKENTAAEFVDIAQDNVNELKEFALANEMNLCVLCDEESILGDISKEFSKAGLCVFAPEGDALRIFNSKSWAKRFIYRTKIPTPKFQIFEKPQLALDYVRQNKFPCVIKPDSHSEIGTRICETFGSAKNAVEEFFDTGSKKIIVEDYIYGKEFSVYVISDGYNPVVLGDCATYQNSFAKFDADFLSDDLKAQIYNNILIPLIAALAKEAGEYTGILGFDFILSGKKCFLIECNPFFRDLDALIFVEAIKSDWADMLESALKGTLCEEFSSPEISQKFYYSAQKYENNEKINIFACGRTPNEAKTMLIDEGADKKEFDEAQKAWKY